MHDQAIVREFSHQADRFVVAPVMRSLETLHTVVQCAVRAGARGVWTEVACGPAIVGGALARHVETVLAVDLTPAMLAAGQREVASRGLTHVYFLRGDATTLPFRDGVLNGAITRFSFHHIPAPQRVLQEMARVVQRDGLVVVADHVTTADSAGMAWHQQIERLRDPSHWACLPIAAFEYMGERCRLELVETVTLPFRVDYEEWLMRGTGGEQYRTLIEDLVAMSEGIEEFHIASDASGIRWLHAKLFVGVWRKL